MPKKPALNRLFKLCGRDWGGWHLHLFLSQAEVRVLACKAMADDEALKAALRSGQDFHKYVASIIFNIPVESVTPDQRQLCKSVNFAVLYGAQAARVAAQTGITEKAAEAFIAKYMATLPGVKKFQESQHRRSLIEGCCWSAFGRRRLLSSDVFSQSEIERRSVNTPIQSTASDITLTSYTRSYNRIKEYGMRSLSYLFVHDSLGFDVYPGEFFDLYEILHHELAVMPPEVYPWLDVPMQADGDAGFSWGNLAKIERLDRNNWKFKGSNDNCGALVHLLQKAGHTFRYGVDGGADKDDNFTWILEVSR